MSSSRKGRSHNRPDWSESNQENAPAYVPPPRENEPAPFVFGSASYAPPTTQQQINVYNAPPNSPRQPTTHYYQDPEGKPVPIKRESPLSDPERGDGETRNNGGGRMESEEERKRSVIIRILRIIFIIFQVLCILAGIGMLILGAVAYREAQKRHLGDTKLVLLPVFAVALGAILMIVAMIGALGAIRRSRFTAVLYCVLMGALIGGEIYALVKARKMLHNPTERVSDWWSEMSETSRVAVQDWQKCCGFEGEGDREVLPCPVDAVGGCSEPLVSIVKRWAGTILKVFITLVIVEVVLMISAILIAYIF